MGRREKVIRQRGIDCSVLALAASLSASVPSIFPSRSVLVHPSFYHSVTRLLHHFVPGDHLDPAVHMTVCLRETGDGDPVSVSSRAGSSVSLTHRPLPDTLHSHPPGNSPEHAGWCSCLPFVPRARSGGRGGEGGRGGRGLPCSLIMDPKVKAVRELCDGLTGMSPGRTMTHDSVALTALLQYRCSLRSRITLCPGASSLRPIQRIRNQGGRLLTLLGAVRAGFVARLLHQTGQNARVPSILGLHSLALSPCRHGWATVRLFPPSETGT